MLKCARDRIRAFKAAKGKAAPGDDDAETRLCAAVAADGLEQSVDKAYDLAYLVMARTIRAWTSAEVVIGRL